MNDSEDAVSETEPKTKSESFADFDAFWLYYLRAHAKASTRLLHFAGAGAGALLAAAIFWWNGPLWALIFVPLVVYGFAFSGHYLAENNHPTTLKYPVWSVICFFRMFRYWLMGRLPAELRRAGA